MESVIQAILLVQGPCSNNPQSQEIFRYLTLQISHTYCYTYFIDKYWINIELFLSSLITKDEISNAVDRIKQ
jgi:hypothetical protein